MSDATTEAQERLIQRERVFNLRDLGGYATADGRQVGWRRLLRADGIHRLEADALADLGVRTVLDLRTDGEVGEARFTAEGVAWHHLPVLRSIWDPATLAPDVPPERFLAERYRLMLDEGAESLGAAVRLLAETPNLPAVFHCAAGKDRTGVLAAIVLGLLGVPDETIAADYALSAAGMDRMLAFIRAEFPERLDTMTDQPKAFLMAPIGAMELFLDEVRQSHGSIRGYAETVGVEDHHVEGLRDALLVAG